MIYVYDIEIYINFFCVIFKNYKTKELRKFIIYKDRNDLKELMDFISNPHLWLAGYNNYNFAHKNKSLNIGATCNFQTACC